MQGVRFFEKLRALAAKLRKTRVIFPGYVTGDRKKAFFALADLYVFPSRHESYGLTLLEALAAGVPAVCLDHHDARSVMKEEFGAIVEPDGPDSGDSAPVKRRGICPKCGWRRAYLRSRIDFQIERRRWRSCSSELCTHLSAMRRLARSISFAQQALIWMSMVWREEP